MNEGWMRVREAAVLFGVSTSTVRRRVEAGELKGRTGKSGRREVFVPKKLRDEHADLLAHDDVPAEALRGTGIGTEKMPSKQAPDENSALTHRAGDDAAAPDDESADEPRVDREMLQRYERMAGGSLMLAEQRGKELKAHVDHAYEQLAHTRSQLRRCRKVAYVGWGAFATALALGFAVSASLGVNLGQAKTQAAAHEQATHAAEKRYQDLSDRLGRLTTAAQFTPDAVAHETIDLGNPAESTAMDPTQPTIFYPAGGFATGQTTTE